MGEIRHSEEAAESNLDLSHLYKCFLYRGGDCVHVVPTGYFREENSSMGEYEGGGGEETYHVDRTGKNLSFVKSDHPRNRKIENLDSRLPR